MFSIVVPVHNVEQYVNQCINSIVTQSFAEFELLLVVNASTDRSLEICKQWEGIDSRIHVIITDVAGVSHARNMGIEQSKKDWIVFVDADDYLLENGLMNLKLRIDESADLIIGNYTQNENDLVLTGKENKIPAGTTMLALLDTPKYFQKIECALTYKADVLGVNWGKAFRKSIIDVNNIRFDETITIFEDFLFNYEFLRKAACVHFFDVPIYFYRVTNESLSRTVTADRVLKRIDFVNKLCEKHELNDIQSAIDFCIVQNVLRIIVATGRNNKDYKQVKQLVIDYLEKEEINQRIEASRYAILSNGRFQNIAYLFIIYFLKNKKYNLSFLIAKLYCRIKHKD